LQKEAAVMNTPSLVLHGQIQPDGTLHIEEKINLPPGPVAVTVQTVAARTRKATLQVLQEIRAAREAQGIVGRTAAEIDAEINAMRDEDELRMQDIESIPQLPPGKRE
jgi:hypothetical protein